MANLANMAKMLLCEIRDAAGNTFSNKLLSVLIIYIEDQLAFLIAITVSMNPFSSMWSFIPQLSNKLLLLSYFLSL